MLEAMIKRKGKKQSGRFWSDVFTANPSNWQHEPFMKLCAEGESGSILCRLWNLSCKAVTVWGTVVLCTPGTTERIVHTVESFD